MENEIKDPKKKFSFGTCAYDITNPSRASLTNTTQILNVVISFEEGLKLNLAIDEALRKINTYKKSTTEGKRAALNLAIFLDQNRLSVNETKLPKSVA